MGQHYMTKVEAYTTDRFFDRATMILGEENAMQRSYFYAALIWVLLSIAWSLRRIASEKI